LSQQHEDDASNFDAHLDLAKFVWATEEENARRLATRKALIIGVPLTFAAFSRSLAGAADAVVRGCWEGAWPARLSLLFAAVSIIYLFRVLKEAFPIRPRQAYRPASFALSPIRSEESAETDLKDFMQLDEPAARAVSAARILQGANGLYAANNRLGGRLQTALDHVLTALLACLISGVCYMSMEPSADKPTIGGPSDDATKGLKTQEEVEGGGPDDHQD